MTKENKKNIAHLNNYSINKTLDMIRQSKRKKFVRIRTGIIFGIGLVLIGVAGFPLIDNTQKTDEFNQLHVEASETLEELEQEQKELEYQVGLLEDEEYIAKLARDELNLSKPHEVLINLPEEEAIDSEDADSENKNIEENETE